MRDHWPGLEKAMVLAKSRVIENVDLSDLELPMAMTSSKVGQVSSKAAAREIFAPFAINLTSSCTLCPSIDSGW